MKTNMTKLEIERCTRHLRKAIVSLNEISVSNTMNLDPFTDFRSEAGRLEEELELFIDLMGSVYFDRYGKEL